ncbi:MAG: hypothetical protein A2408_00980 [Candidatus Yonathbacteria bacterium RIFOXYC1_FULL_52_10]|uniref:EfeO-type cupredoxin-like domain-containing protein n=1 Tax=Candidatus Yonathbacteria bacterium RIFOXYD1_FULL_52_36 TaxID=1802730 RepID=A0A1G2SN04_9BACT|nr:MAG: hypothetical protein A2408_00980 [Candidatus Yonathbacteria bacterium RIFOXYC1_FULL_52_10]OHA86366.1 MAG: hypothetical protein A2591_02605 [Candidatus Yonathbacteria bacterium RIFOXYD1_FULL_52_36]
MNTTVISILIAVVLIGGAFVLVRNDTGTGSDIVVNNVTVVDGVQIVEIKAKGGYLPRRSVAQAGLPTVLRFDTSGTFDCSSSVRIPSLDISKILPQTGSTDIDIGTPKSGIFQGSCSMGMYPFEVDFQN